MRFLLIVVTLCSASKCAPAAAQMLADTLFTWKGYEDDSICRVRVYRSAEGEAKPFTIVVSELAQNRGRSTLEDTRLVVELVGRAFDIDPEQVYWVFHWGAFSFAEEGSSNKEAFFRATFRRGSSGSLGSPSWRLMSRDLLAEYTDRAFR